MLDALKTALRRSVSRCGANASRRASTQPVTHPRDHQVLCGRTIDIAPSQGETKAIEGRFKAPPQFPPTGAFLPGQWTSPAQPRSFPARQSPSARVLIVRGWYAAGGESCRGLAIVHGGMQQRDDRPPIRICENPADVRSLSSGSNARAALSPSWTGAVKPPGGGPSRHRVASSNRTPAGAGTQLMLSSRSRPPYPKLTQFGGKT